jgi:CBS domain-containing protein
MRLVKDFMRKRVVCFRPDDSIFKVAKCFATKGISGAPVVDKCKVVGIVSESDLIKFIKSQTVECVRAELGLSLSLLDMLRKYISLRKQLKQVSKVKVKDVMNKTVISVRPDSTLSEAAELMDKYDIHRLPVIENDKLVGIISRADLIHSLIK